MTFAHRFAGVSLTVACAAASIFNRPAIAQPAQPAGASPLPSAMIAPAAGATVSPSGTFGCPLLASITSADGSDYTVAFESSDTITAAIALRLYAGDHDYLVTLPNVTFPLTQSTGSRLSYRSKPIHLRKPPGQDVFALSVSSTEQSPRNVLCDVRNLDVEPPEQTVLAGKVAPGSGGAAEGVDLIPAVPTHFTCTNPFANALVEHAVQPVVPRFAGAGVVSVKVKIAVDGSVTAASVYESSGIAALDGAALTAAKESTYRAGLNDCKPISGSYLFVADFVRG